MEPSELMGPWKKVWSYKINFVQKKNVNTSPLEFQSWSSFFRTTSLRVYPQRALIPPLGKKLSASAAIAIAVSATPIETTSLFECVHQQSSQNDIYLLRYLLRKYFLMQLKANTAKSTRESLICKKVRQRKKTFA